MAAMVRVNKQTMPCNAKGTITVLLVPFTGPERSKQHAMMGITHLVIGA